jgi:hypothetical protein
VRHRFILSIFYFLLTAVTCYSQQVDLDVRNVPLNQVLIGLRDKYKLELSFNDDLLSRYNLTIKNTWDSPENAIQSIIGEFPLTYLKQGAIFMILPKKKQVTPENFLLFGQVTEARSNEPLPFSQIYVDDRILVSDQKGSFSYQNTGNGIFRVKITHLGYFILDTIVVAGINHRFNLIPSVIGLREVVIKDKLFDRSTIIGNKAGVVKVNHQIARYLPGSGDNSVFTLLRLMPGILASSEQSNGLIIWGSYEGHSQVLLDGFTIWGLKSFNDDIDAVNPLVAKEIEVLKGGYDASYGGRVGGIVNVAGKTGSMLKPTFSLNINNVTVNGMAEIPLWKNSSLIMSFRQTYYNLYKGKDIYPANNENEIVQVDKTKSKIDYTVLPDYYYRDANVRFTTRNNKGELFYLSMLGGQDRFRYSIKPFSTINGLFKINAENNYQYGASAFYGRTWHDGNITNFTTSWSSLETGLSNIQSIQRQLNVFDQIGNDQTYNKIAEYSGRVDNFIKLSRSHTLEAGLGFARNEVGLKADSSGYNQTNLKTQVARIDGFLQDHISLPGEIEIKFGIRTDLPFNLGKIYVQPRLSTSIKITDFIKFNAAWGVYNQFISKSSVLDNQGNYRYIWTSCDNQQIPVLKAVHWVAGSSFHRDNLTVSLEAYSKSTDGLTRFMNTNQKYKDLIYSGIGRSYGLDFFVKKDFKGHSAWISYTLSKTDEKFSYFSKNEFQPAPQDQRHELKVAVLFNVNPFNFSANYIFGSGFPLNNGTTTNPVYINPDYNRIDVAVNYRFNIGKVAGETGLSLLNLFDSTNIRYSNFEKVPVDQSNTLNIYSQAVPFSPRISLRLYY